MRRQGPLAKRDDAAGEGSTHLLKLLFARVDVKRADHGANLAHVAGLAAFTVENGKGCGRGRRG